MNNVIIIGAGGIGERHIRCFQRLVTGRVGLVESNSERRELIASRYGCLAFPTWSAANEAADWDFGVVAVPAQIHVPMALDLLAAGVDVLIEKPLAVSLEGLDELKRYDATRTIRVAYVYRHMELVIELKRRLEDASLGAPLSAQIVCGEDFSIARPDYAKLYYARHQTGGGAIQDVLTHFVNAMDWLVGPARKVQCLAANRKLRDVAVEDTVSCSILHDGGCLANYYIAQGQVTKEISFTIHCEQGSICANITRMRIGTFVSGSDDWQWSEFPPCDRDSFYERQAADFLGALAGRSGHAASLDEAIHSLKVNLAALESAKTGQSIEILKRWGTTGAEEHH